jgi:hypothetical protein
MMNQKLFGSSSSSAFEEKNQEITTSWEPLDLSSSSALENKSRSDNEPPDLSSYSTH